jgi:vitamin B12 transporter
MTRHGGAAVNGVAGAFDYSLGAARFQSDNRVPNSRLENTTLSASVGFRLAADASLRFVARGELEETGTPGPTAFGRPDLDAAFERNDGAFGVTFDQTVTRAFRQRASYSAALSHQASTNLVIDPSYVATFEGRTALFPSDDFAGDRRDRFRRHHASYQADWRLAGGGAAGDQLLTLLADWDGERVTFADRLAGTTAAHRRDNFGGAVQQQMLWRRIFLTAGGRVERNENFGTAFVPRLSAVFVVREAGAVSGETRVKLSAGAGIKEPTMLESYSTSPYFLGNPALKAERSRSVEAGLEQRFGGDRAKVDATWFDNRYTNIISLRTDFATFEGQFFNVGVTRARGVEIGGEVAPVAGLRAWGSYTLLDSEIVESTAPDNPLFAVGAWAFRRPRHSGSLGGIVKVGRTTVDLTGVFIGRFVDSDFGLFSPALVESPGHTTWDLRAAVQLTAGLTALLTIDNLANAAYSEPFGYEPLGRVVRAGVRVRF